MKDTHVAILIEEFRSELQAVAEGVSMLQPLLARTSKIEQDISEIKLDIRLMKAVLTDYSHELSSHERRITRLEATT